MPFCAVANCKNKSDEANMKNGGISYHHFPKEPEIKEKWIDATGRKNWFPTKYSTICSCHFSGDDFDVTKKIRKLFPNVYPEIDVWRNDKSHDDSTSDLKKRNIISASSKVDATISETLRKKRLRKLLIRSKQIQIQQCLKIKRLREQNRRKEKKILKLEELVNKLKTLLKLKKKMFKYLVE